VKRAEVFLLVGIIAAAFAVRAWVVWRVLHGRSFRRDTSLTAELEPADTDAYFAYAKGLAERGEYSSVPGRLSAHRPPLYPLFLAAFFRMFGVKATVALWANAVLGAVSVLLTFLLARILLLPAGALLSSAVAAFDPYLVISSGWLMSEAFCILLFLLFLLLLVEPRQGKLQSALLGVLFAGLILARSAWPVLGILPVAVILSRKTLPRKALLYLAVFALSFLGAYLPWVVRNYIAMGTFIPFTTHGGYSLLVSNNENFYRAKTTQKGDWPEDDFARWQRKLSAETSGMNEVEKDVYCYRKAMEFIRADPGRFFHLFWIRLKELWKLHRHAASHLEARVSDVYIFLLYLLSILGIVRLRKRKLSLFVFIGAMILFSAVYGVYGAEIRYRLPLVPVLGLLASAGLFGVRELPEGKGVEL